MALLVLNCIAIVQRMQEHGASMLPSAVGSPSPRDGVMCRMKREDSDRIDSGNMCVMESSSVDLEIFLTVLLANA